MNDRALIREYKQSGDEIAFMELYGYYLNEYNIICGETKSDFSYVFMECITNYNVKWGKSFKIYLDERYKIFIETGNMRSSKKENAKTWYDDTEYIDDISNSELLYDNIESYILDTFYDDVLKYMREVSEKHNKVHILNWILGITNPLEGVTLKEKKRLYDRKRDFQWKLKYSIRRYIKFKYPDLYNGCSDIDRYAERRKEFNIPFRRPAIPIAYQGNFKSDGGDLSFLPEPYYPQDRIKYYIKGNLYYRYNGIFKTNLKGSVILH